ncbi:hypothetical protein [Jiella avicenniae]|uniref:Uncharacterized protein n=1 Tax=Jiella avicenniae TaxID=2907202 RepID=A0A9X1P0H3_9HYPH|nr:hypothetical protein [Jiella avicenniae]MCE7027093.1 hypothetical protein [Jiella avicenniae]
MSGPQIIASMMRTVIEFFRPSYRPERYYMRGPGPACARKTGRTLAA